MNNLKAYILHEDISYETEEFGFTANYSSDDYTESYQYVLVNGTGKEIFVKLAEVVHIKEGNKFVNISDIGELLDKELKVLGLLYLKSDRSLFGGQRHSMVGKLIKRLSEVKIRDLDGFMVLYGVIETE